MNKILEDVMEEKAGKKLPERRDRTLSIRP
jgi:hypothetical protein